MNGNTQCAMVVEAPYAHTGTGQLVRLRSVELAALLEQARETFGPEGVILMYSRTMAETDTDVPGWKRGQPGPWTLYQHAQGQVVAVGFLPDMSARHFDLFGPSDDPGVIATRLDRYQRMTGTAWRGTYAATGLSAVRNAYPGQYQPLWRIEPQTTLQAVGPMVWTRPLNQWERQNDYVHTWDAQSAYLGAMGNAELAWSQLARTGERSFDKRLPGYWLIELDPYMIRRFVRCEGDFVGAPPLIPPQRLRHGTQVWLTTPIATLLEDYGMRLEVLDSVTAQPALGKTGNVVHAPSARVLRPFAEHMRDQRPHPTAAPEWLRTAWKRTYKDVTGGMQRTVDGGMRICRPDWAHTFIDGWRANLYRRIYSIAATHGVWPVSVKTDSVSYVDCWENTVLDQSFGIQRGVANPWRLGGWRRESTVTVTSWIDKHERKGASDGDDD